jgi:hypothetical protein
MPVYSLISPPIKQYKIRMKKLLLPAAALTLIFFACKKKGSGDDGPAPVDGNNKWKVGESSYTASAMSVNGGLITATNDTQSVSVTFSDGSLPSANGTIPVSHAFGTGLSIAVTEGTVPVHDIYYSTGKESKNATVTINNGKVTVSVPTVWAKNLKGDSLQVSANLIQP